MIISGFTGVSLLDYPGKVSSIIYTSPCNLRCPFCHNPSLVKNAVPQYEPIEIIAELNERKGFVEAVTITGGEPLMHDDLADFLRIIKAEGLLVKIDTNGTYPDGLEYILKNRLADYVAMDIKSSPEKYAQACGSAAADMAKVKRSAEIIISSGVSHCFRTTAVPGIVEPGDVAEAVKMIQGAECYVIQQFSNENTLSEKYKTVKPYQYTMLLSLLDEAKPHVKKAEIHNLKGELTARS